MTANAPLTPIYVNNAGWDRSKSRCAVEGEFLFEAPMPVDFVVSPDTWAGLMPNSGLAVLMPDGRTLKQTQPFARCNAGDTATSKYMFEDQDLFGPGTFGAHGGSGLSAIGGTLRLGELRPSSGPLRHVLKVNIYAAKNLYYDEGTKGYRWPAIKSDSYAADNYGTKRTNSVVKECRMGALLALPANWDVDTMSFETVPGRMPAEAF